MSSALISFFGWSYLPAFATGHLQTFYYNFAYRVGEPKPQPGTPLYAKHYRRIYGGVILLYLLYTLYEADWIIRRAGDFYNALGVPLDVGEKELNSRFRRLTLQLHPDKLPPNLPPAHREAAEAQLLYLQLAKDTLIDPAKRFAYDRLGPDVLDWKHAKTIRDFVVIGGQRMIPFYIGSIVGMLGAQWFGIFETSGSYWRYLTLAALFLFELSTITSPTAPIVTYFPTIGNPISSFVTALPSPLALLIRQFTRPIEQAFGLPRPPYLPFQAIQLAHRATLTIFIALSRLAPLFRAPTVPGASPQEAELVQGVQRLEQLISNYAVEAMRLLALEGAPFAENLAIPERGPQPTLQHSRLLPHIKNFLVTNTLRQDPQVQAAVASVLARRRGENATNVTGSLDIAPKVDSREEEPGSQHLNIATATSPSLLDASVTQDEIITTTDSDGETTPPATRAARMSSILIDADRITETERSSAPPPEPEALIDPGELADTEGETPLFPPATSYHTHNHAQKHARHRSTSNAALLGQSVDILSASDLKEARREAETAEGYEGDVEGNVSGTGT